MRFLVIMFLIFTCSSSFAGFPWADDFEANDGDWTATRDFNTMLSSEYNATVEANSTQSLRLVSDSLGFTIESASRPASSTIVFATTSTISFWFYDDNFYYKAFKLGIEDSTPSGTRDLFIGAADNLPLNNPGRYFYSANGLTTFTEIERSKGWHFTEITTDANGSRLYLDGTEVAGSYNPHLVNPETVRLSATPILGATGMQSAVWVDDVRFNVGLETRYSEQAGPWNDDMEGPPLPVWDNGFLFNPYQSGDYDHTNDENSSFSMKLQANSATPHLERLTELQYEEDSTGTLSFWFYDDGQTTNGFVLGADVASFTAGEGKLRGATIGIGVVDAPDAMSGEYLLAKDSETTPTGFARTVGWHHVEVTVDSEGARVRLDNQDVAGNFFPGYTRIIRASMETFYLPGETEAYSQVWVDDVVYERNLPTSDVKDWSVY